MRRSLSLGLLLVALSALPATAGQEGGVHVFLGSRPHFARHFHHFTGFNRFNRFSHFNRFSNFNGSFGNFGFSFNSFGFNRFDRFGRSRFFAPFGLDWGLADWDGWPAVGGAPGTMIVLAGAPPAAAAPPPPPAKATVETEAGVTVFRGPGSHHAGY